MTFQPEFWSSVMNFGIFQARVLSEDYVYVYAAMGH